MENEILALPMECWRWVPSYEGLYQVSTRGRVRSVDRWVNSKGGSKHFREGQILRPARNRKGYLYVGLSRDNKRRLFTIHRLVAMAWLDNPEGKPQVNHRDEQKDNNDVYNIEFVSAKENTNWGTGLERRVASRSLPVQAINPTTGEVVLEFPSTAEGGRKGFDSGCISRCCRGIKYKTYKGYIWRYKP